MTLGSRAAAVDVKPHNAAKTTGTPTSQVGRRPHQGRLTPMHRDEQERLQPQHHGHQGQRSTIAGE